MSETNENIIDQPNDGPRTTDISNEPPRADCAYDPDRFVLLPPSMGRWWRFLRYMVIDTARSMLAAVLVVCVGILVLGLVMSTLVNVRVTDQRYQSINNCNQMVIAVNEIASNTTTGDIPPAYGPFPAGSTTNQSFFVSLLPYIEQQNLYNNQAIATPVKTYIALTDPNNPGTIGLISYGSNATLLTVGGSPKLPSSFNGRMSSIILVFERTAKSGATWSSSNSYLIDKNGSSSPEIGSAASWSSYGSRATALASATCIAGMGDGSARVVTQSNANAGWAWAMNPQDPADQPLGW